MDPPREPLPLPLLPLPLPPFLPLPGSRPLPGPLSPQTHGYFGTGRSPMKLLLGLARL